MGLICSILGHKWDCYQCLRCGQKREKEQHDWDGCICRKCGKTLAGGVTHVWQGCTCTKCGLNRDTDHLYVNVQDTCETVCSICGKAGEKQHMLHSWVDDKCIRCGILKKDFEIAVRVALILDKMGMTYSDYARTGFINREGYGVRHEIQEIQEEYGQEGIDQLLAAIQGENEEYGHFVSFVKDSWPDLYEKTALLNP